MTVDTIRSPDQPFVDRLIDDDANLNIQLECDLRVQEALLSQYQAPLRSAPQPAAADHVRRVPDITTPVNVEVGLLTRIYNAVVRAFQIFVNWISSCFSCFFARDPGSLPAQGVNTEEEVQPARPIEQVVEEVEEIQVPLEVVQRDQRAFCMNFLTRFWDQFLLGEVIEDIHELIQESAQSNAREFPRIQEILIPNLGDQTQNYRTQIHYIKLHAMRSEEKVSIALLKKREEVHLIVIDVRDPNCDCFHHFNPNEVGSFDTFDQANKLAAHLDKEVPIEAEHPITFHALSIDAE